MVFPLPLMRLCREHIPNRTALRDRCFVQLERGVLCVLELYRPGIHLSTYDTAHLLSMTGPEHAQAMFCSGGSGCKPKPCRMTYLGFV